MSIMISSFLQEPGEEPKPGQIGRRRFTLHVKAGSFTDSEIIVMLGEVRKRAYDGPVNLELVTDLWGMLCVLCM